MPVKNKPQETLVPAPSAGETEADKEIEGLEEQVRHAEEHGGQTDTAHHEMLRRARAPKVKEETKEITNG